MIRRFRIRVDGQEYEVEVEEVGTGQPAGAPFTPAPPGPVSAAPSPEPAAASPATRPSAPAPAAGTITAPLPGIILDLRVTAGQQVAEGDILCILEAMKMENEITAPAAGTVKSVNVTKGAAVNLGDVLFVVGA